MQNAINLKIQSPHSHSDAKLFTIPNSKDSSENSDNFLTLTPVERKASISEVLIYSGLEYTFAFCKEGIKEYRGNPGPKQA